MYKSLSNCDLLRAGANISEYLSWEGFECTFSVANSVLCITVWKYWYPNMDFIFNSKDIRIMGDKGLAGFIIANYKTA